jgi:hypothetical protein
MNKDAEREISNLRTHIKILKRKITRSRIALCGTDARQNFNHLPIEIAQLRRQIHDIDRLRN